MILNALYSSIAFNELVNFNKDRELRENLSIQATDRISLFEDVN